jgi:hypothetical protein
VNYKSRTYFLPIQIALGFNLLTVALYSADLFLNYPDKNRLLLLVFLSAVFLLTAGGYYLGVKSRITLYNTSWMTKVSQMGFICVVTLFIPSVQAYTGQPLSSFVELALNPVAAYKAMGGTVSGSRDERLSFLLISSALSPFIVVVLPVYLMQYFLTGRKKTQTLIVVLLSFVMAIFRGTDKEFFDVFIIGFSAFLVAASIKHKIGMSYFFGRKLFVICAMMIVLFSVFSFRKSERLEGQVVFCLQNTSICHDLSFGNEVTPMTVGVIMMYRYVTHGYGGLEASLDAEPSFGYGVGHSRPLSYIFNMVFPGVETHGVVSQLDELGWSSSNIWSTGYVWFFNDLPIMLVPLLFFGLAYLLGRTWKEVIHGQDKVSLVIFVYLMYSFIYMPLNLQLAQVGVYYLGFLFWVLFYLLRKAASTR